LLAAFAEWDLRLAPDSRAAAAYGAIRARVATAMLTPLLDEPLRELLLGGAVHPLFGTGPYLGRVHPRLVALLEAGRPGPGAAVDPGARDALLVEALTAVAAGGAETWGTHHRVAFRHPLAAAFPALRRLFDRGPFPIGGDFDTIHQAGSSAGAGLISRAWAPFYRAVYDTSDWGASRAIHAPGQSGHPASAHYADLIPDWLALRLRPMPFGHAYEAALPGPVQHLIIKPAAVAP
jgi:penicillin amidase